MFFSLFFSFLCDKAAMQATSEFYNLRSLLYYALQCKLQEHINKQSNMISVDSHAWINEDLGASHATP